MFMESIFFMLALSLALLFCFGIPVLIAVCVYRDANKRVDCTPWLWALVAAFVPSFIGVVVYLIVRRDYPLKVGASGPTGGSNAETSYAHSDYDSHTDTSERGTGIPTWAKVLIIIGTIVISICSLSIIGALVYSMISYGTNSGIDYHGF